MQELIVRSWNGFNIEFELIDGQLMANATSMCTSFKKRPTKWLELEATKGYIIALEEEDAKKALSVKRTLVETRNGGTNPGTWIVEDLILELAGWLNTPFKIQMHKWMAELLRTGSVSLKPKTSLEVLHEVVQNLMEQDSRITAVERKVDEVSARQVLTEVNFFTIVGWAKLQKKSVTDREARALGVKASNLSKQTGVKVEKLPNGSWGTINSYHRSILQQVL